MEQLIHRGPDNLESKLYSNCGLAHARLSVIDTSSAANQPFCDESGRYTLVFNGEIYNYREIRSQLEQEGIQFKTNSDTEVLLILLIKEGVAALDALNGFFAFAFYDLQKNELLLARDRFGIKPLILYADENKYIFSSELSAIYKFPINKTLNQRALNHFFSLTYCPGQDTILEKAEYVLPGHYVIINANDKKIGRYYQYYDIQIDKSNYLNNKTKLVELLSTSVKDRLVSDVPLGSFLSGGLDSSIISLLAKDAKNDLNTFSIGFDHPYFDESKYAEEVAKHINSNHHTYRLTEKDFKQNFDDFLAQLSEPFADSSAFAMNLLSKNAREEVTVCLSGDGADELFAGYRKHWAEHQLKSLGSLKKTGVKAIATLLSGSASSRQDKRGEFNRKIQKFSRGLRLPDDVRYWEWSSFIDDEDRQNMLIHPVYQGLNLFDNRSFDDLNDVLRADQEMVLPSDMLRKVDMMSMAHNLEVRTPFLDHRVVEFANSLPVEQKIGKKAGKKILREAFAARLPESVVNREKSGFEIPIQAWLGEDIDRYLGGKLFSRDFLHDQGVFNPIFIEELKLIWNRPQFGDKIYIVWALLVFQSWWNRFYD